MNTTRMVTTLIKQEDAKNSNFLQAEKPQTYITNMSVLVIARGLKIHPHSTPIPKLHRQPQFQHPMQIYGEVSTLCSAACYSQWRIQGGGDAGMHPPHQLDTIIYAGIYWRTVATVVVSV
jgi:hypothetical protein